MSESSEILKGVPEQKLSVEAEDGLARDATDDSKNQLVLHNMREAFFYALHICRGKLPGDEVFSAAYLALSHAAKNYKPGTKPGIRFFAYAKPYVRGAICKEWKSKDVVKNAKHESLDLPGETDYYLTEQAANDCAAENNSIEADEFDRLGCCDPEFAAIQINDQMALLKPMLRSLLSDHERMVIELAYFGHYNFEDIGKQLGVTRSAVQNTHTRAIQKLRAGITRKQKLLKKTGSQ